MPARTTQTTKNGAAASKNDRAALVKAAAAHDAAVEAAAISRDELVTAEKDAWRRFAQLSRQYRQAVGDLELSSLLIVRARAAFETWVVAAEALGQEVK